jgi:general secretion pathway protein G
MKATIHSTSRQRVTTSAGLRSGFTLTELLIVMAILVLLVSLVGPRVLGTKKKADINSTRTQIGLFETSLERYAIDMNVFPSTEESLQALIKPPMGEESGAEEEKVATKWDGPYLRKSEIPLDPWGNEYQYEYPPTHGTDDMPDIWSFGPDGEDGTEDDIVSWTTTEGGSEEIADVPSPEPPR